MAFDIGQLVGFVKIDHSGVRTGMAAAEREVKASTSRMGQQADRDGKAVGAKFGNGLKSNIKSSFDEVGKSWKTLGAGLLAGLAVGGVVDFFKSATSAASELEQSVGGVEAVFGKYADTVQAKSAEAAQALGLSKNSYNELITVSAAMLKNKGLEDFAQQSEKLIGIGADLAAQYGGPTSQAVEALNAAMRGESDPIERYGISLNESAVNAVLLEKGLTGLTGAALEQAKTQARLELITRQSADAQGAFAREADTAAGKQQRLSAEWENQQAILGQKLLPIMTAVTDFAATKVVPTFSALVETIAALAGAVNSIPGPVKTAIVVLTLFHLLKGPLSSMLETVRLKAMYAGDAIGRMGKAGAGSALKSSIGGIVGALGGLSGVAVTGAVVGLGAFMEAQNNAKAAAESLIDTIDKETGKFGELSQRNIRDALLGDLDPADAKLLSDLGISFTEGADAALAGGDKLEAYRQKIAALTEEYQRNGGIVDDTGRALEGYGRSLENQGEVVGAATDLITVKGREDAKAAGSADKLATATAGASGAAEKAAPAAKSYTDQIAELKTKSADAAEKQKALSDAMNDVVDAALSADEATSNYEEAVDAARKAAEENGKTTNKARTELDLNTEAGRNNASALRDLAADARASAEANLTNGDSAAQVTAKMTGKGGMRDAFIAAAEKMGLSKKAAREMADEYGLTKTGVDNLKGSMDKIPAEVVSKLKVEKDAAERKLAEFKAILSGVRDKTVTISAIYQVTGSLAQANAAANQRRLDQNVNDRRFGGPVPGYAGGTLIGPGTGTSDSIRAFVRETGRALNVSAGEFISTDSSRRRNLAALEAGNRGAMLGVIGQGGSGPTQLHPDTIDALVAGFAHAASRVSPVVDLEDMSGRLTGGM